MVMDCREHRKTIDYINLYRSEGQLDASSSVDWDHKWQWLRRGQGRGANVTSQTRTLSQISSNFPDAKIVTLSNLVSCIHFQGGLTSGRCVFWRSCLKNVIKCPGLLSYWTFQEGLRQTTIFMINLLVVPEAHGVTSSDFLFLLKWVQNSKMFKTKETKKYTCLRSWKPDYFCQSFLKTWLIDYQKVAD